MPSLKEIKTYLKTDLKLPLVVSKNIEDKFESVTQIYPKSPSLVMLYMKLLCFSKSQSMLFSLIIFSILEIASSFASKYFFANSRPYWFLR